MRTKLMFFALGLVCGGLAVFLVFGYQTGIIQLHTSEERELADQIEAIPIESVCNSISSGKQILGDDHVTVWSDQKRYVVAGWRVGKSVPIFYWTGADLPTDIPGCKKRM
jgi:hypothetical protein